MAETLIWITFGLFVGVQAIDWLYTMFKIYKALGYDRDFFEAIAFINILSILFFICTSFVLRRYDLQSLFAMLLLNSPMAFLSLYVVNHYAVNLDIKNILQYSKPQIIKL
jgi:hypothetical protein